MTESGKDAFRANGFRAQGYKFPQTSYQAFTQGSLSQKDHPYGSKYSGYLKQNASTRPASTETTSVTSQHYHFEVPTSSTNTNQPRYSYSKATSSIKQETQSIETPDTNTVSRLDYEKLKKEYSSYVRKAEMELKNKDERIEGLGKLVKELKIQMAEMEEKYAALAQENERLKKKEQEMKLKKPSSRSTTHHVSRKATNGREALPQFEEIFEESKQMERPEGMSNEEWHSLQLAIQLQQEEARRLQKKRGVDIEELAIMKAIHESCQERVFDPNRSLSSLNPSQVNPDNMTYEQLLQLGEKIGHVSKGLPKEEIAKIRKLTYRKTIGKTQEEQQCMICFCEYEDGDQLRRLNCKHDFHSECIEKWLGDSKMCPVCKKEVIQRD